VQCRVGHFRPDSGDESRFHLNQQRQGARLIEVEYCLRQSNNKVSASPADSVRISIPKCDPGIGHVIRTPESADLIEGVVARPFDLWPDDRRRFSGREHAGIRRPSYPGTINAFHYHLDQTDLWVPASGMFQVTLVDLRHLRRKPGEPGEDFE